MKKRFKIRDLDYFLLDTRNPPRNCVDKVEKAFRFWKATWEEAFKQIDVNFGNQLNSDPFLEREASALFFGEEPVALFFNDWFEVRESHLSHSYFNNYPGHVIQSVKDLGFSRVMVLSFMTIHPNWRKRYTDVPLADVLFSLGVKRFESSGTPVLIGYIRKDNGSFHQVFERHGGTVIDRSSAYNVDVDFMYMTQKSKRLSPLPGVADTVNILWEKKNLKTNNNNVYAQEAAV